MVGIFKQFEFDYGHRVWTQKLNKEYSLDNRTVCRHLHGHRGIIIIELFGEPDSSGMVTDFKHLNWFKKWVDDNIDHKFLIDINDPLFTSIIPNVETFGLVDIGSGMRIVDTARIKDTEYLELLESFVVVDFVPTSELICQWIHGIVSEKMAKIDIFVKAVTFKETPKTQAKYKSQ